ncbi:MAG: cytidine deaminase [Candidatus Cloacimonetes bacterium]|nr:cytidine deaminase [Candidatus Cloacimonadota bacterium]
MNKELIKIAKKVSQNAHAPYSNFKVGAALITKSGKIFSGCNVENASYGLTMCAERVAIFKAVSEGFKEFIEMVIYVDSDTLFSPCGACRQVIAEFSSDIKITIFSNKEQIETTIKELLPLAFKL